MSRVTVTELTPESVATAANANATLSSWNATSADIDETNAREMGFDRRSMGTRAFTPADGRPTPLLLAGPSSALVPTGVPLQVAFGATLVEIGPINYSTANGDQLYVACSFNYLLTAGAGQVGTFSLGYASASGGPWTEIAQTRRRTQLSPGLLALVAGLDDNASIVIGHKFTANTSTTLYIALLYALTGAANMTVDNLQFQAELNAR